MRVGSRVQPAAQERVSLNLAHLPVLERYGGKRGRQALALIAAGQMVAPIAKHVYGRLRRSEDFTITVPGVDDIYPDLHEWVLDRIPEDERKALIANTDLDGGVSHDSYGRDSDEARVRLRYDGSRSQSVRIDGHKVIVAVERENVPERASLPENWRSYMEKITFTAGNPAGRDAVVGMIEGLLQEKQNEEQPPAMYMPSRWGGDWVRRGDLPQRSVGSTILKEGQIESLTADLSQFLADEEEYNRLSQPWHRGYIFYGPPGTGKTSVARALANQFGLATYYLPLGDIDKDTNLMSLVAAIQPRSVLLLEDVDVYHAATERRETKKKVSVAAMLNALDGVWTPHGLVTIMTTNNRKALDPALVRAGRVSVEEEFSMLDDYQARRLAEFLGLPGADTFGLIGRSPADLIEKLRGERSSHNAADSEAVCASGG